MLQVLYCVLGVQLGRSTGNVDPFTGNPDAQYANSTPMTSQTPTPNQESAFRAGSNLGNVDPYTGHSAMSGVSTSSDLTENEYFPLNDFLTLFNSNFAKDAEKIVEFNEKTQYKLPSEALKMVLFTNPDLSSIDNATSDIMSCLLTWEIDFVFPFFDICIHFTKSEKFCKSIEPKMKAILDRIIEIRNSPSKPSQAMAMRFLANLSGYSCGQNALNNCASELTHVVESYSSSTINPVSLALSTLILNLSVLAHKESSEMSYLYLVPAFSQMISRDILDEETTFRCLVAIGTVCQNCEVMREACKGSNLVHVIENVATKLNSAKVNECCSKLTKVLKWACFECKGFFSIFNCINTRVYLFIVGN